MAMNDINEPSKWESFCKRLIAMTDNGTLEWTDWSDEIQRPDAISPLLVAKHREWTILIYKCERKDWCDERNYELIEDVVMELIDDDGKSRWLLPKAPSRYRLLDHVQFKKEDVQGLLDDILSGNGEQ